MSQTGKTETSVRSVNVFRIDSCLLEHWPLNLLIFFLFSFQTKEALFTILQDLRPEDHFNIIGFSNRIKVWQQDRLVPVTPNNIRDAKKYIHNMSPTGGRNEINIAIQNSVPLQNVVVKKIINQYLFMGQGSLFPTFAQDQVTEGYMSCTSFMMGSCPQSWL